MNERGSVLLMALSLMILLVGLTGGFLYAAGVFINNSGWEETDALAFWLAEAGMQRAIWNLKTPVSSGGQGEGWTTAGVTQSLGGGSYTMVVEQWDFALSSNGSTASATSSAAGMPASRAIDNNNATFWGSNARPTVANPQDLIIALPYTMTVNRVRFLAPAASTRPRDYSWAVSTNGVAYTTVLTVNNNTQVDSDNFNGPDLFSAQSNVNYVRLRTTQDGQGNPQRVRVSTLQIIGRRVTSTGTITAGGDAYTRTVRGTVVTDDASPQSQVAYKEPDWTEL